MSCVENRTSGNGTDSQGKENGPRIADGPIRSLRENKGHEEGNREREGEQREIEGDRDIAWTLVHFWGNKQIEG